MKQIGEYFWTGVLVLVAVGGSWLSGLLLTAPLYFVSIDVWYVGAAIFGLIGVGKLILENDIPSREAREEAKRRKQERFVASYTQPGLINWLRREFRLW